MADTLDIVTLAEAYEAINNPSGTGHDTELARWITGVSRRIDELCGPVVIRTTTNEGHNGGGSFFHLRQTPVDSVTSVIEYRHETATTLTAETNTNRPADAYLTDLRGHYARITRRSGGADAPFPFGRLNVVATYEAGRAADTASVDPQFKLAAGSILRRLWQREAGAWARGGDPFMNAGSGSAGFFNAFDQIIKELLKDELRQRRAGGVMVA